MVDVSGKKRFCAHVGPHARLNPTVRKKPIFVNAADDAESLKRNLSKRRPQFLKKGKIFRALKFRA